MSLTPHWRNKLLTDYQVGFLDAVLFQSGCTGRPPTPVELKAALGKLQNFERLGPSPGWRPVNCWLVPVVADRRGNRQDTRRLSEAFIYRAIVAERLTTHRTSRTRAAEVESRDVGLPPAPQRSNYQGAGQLLSATSPSIFFGRKMSARC